MNHIIRCIAALLLCGIAQADVIVDWNTRADAIATDKRLTAPLYGRSLAMMHVAMFEAVNAIDRRYQPYRLNLVADRNTSRELAAATAGHDVLAALYPDQKAALDALFELTLVAVPEGPPRERALILGHRAAAEILELRKDDGASAPDTYRPVTQPGQYMPTATMASTSVGAWTPWVMTRGDQFRPRPPPADEHGRSGSYRCRRRHPKRR